MKTVTSCPSVEWRRAYRGCSWLGIAPTAFIDRQLRLLGWVVLRPLMPSVIWPSGMNEMKPRVAQVKRCTNETQIALTLRIDGTGKAVVHTGVAFFDHMLT